MQSTTHLTVRCSVHSPRLLFYKKSGRLSALFHLYLCGRIAAEWLINMEYLKAFLVGGLLCLVGQILIDKTKLTPARILVSYVVIGVLLGAVGVYKPLVEWAGAGATVPLTGFGYNIAKGVKEAIDQTGFLGIFTGGLKATAGGITAAIIAGLLASFLFKAKDKA